MTDLIKTSDNLSEQIIRRDGKFFFPLTTLSEILETDKKRLLENIRRNKDEFGELGILNLRTPGGMQDSYILNEPQTYLLCMITRSEKAKQFRKAFAETLQQIREKEYVHISQVQKLLKYQDIAKGINPFKFSKYKKWRKLGLTRAECCKAFDLPYKTMAKVDDYLGYKKECPEHLKPFIHQKQLSEA